MVQGIVRGSNNDSSGDMMALDVESAGEDLTGKDPPNRGGQAHGFVDARVKVDA